jgi:hypothetical protein
MRPRHSSILCCSALHHHHYLLKPCRIFSKKTFKWPTTKDALPVNQFIVVHRLGGEQGSPTAKQRSLIGGVLRTKELLDLTAFRSATTRISFTSSKTVWQFSQNVLLFVHYIRDRSSKLQQNDYTSSHKSSSPRAPRIRGKEELSHRRNRALSSTQNGETVQGPTSLRQYGSSDGIHNDGPVVCCLFRANSQWNGAVRAKSRNQQYGQVRLRKRT